MFAVVKTGGKQYRVAKDDVLKVEKLDGEKGEKILLTDVLMIVDGDKQNVGSPTIDGAAVEVEVIDQGRAKKIIVFKKKRRQNYRRKKGHRQDITILRVTDILKSGAKPGVKKAAPKAVAKPAVEKPTVKKAEAAPVAKPAAKAVAKKAVAKKTVAKSAVAKKTTAKKAAAKKPAAKKS